MRFIYPVQEKRKKEESRKGEERKENVNSILHRGRGKVFCKSSHLARKEKYREKRKAELGRKSGREKTHPEIDKKCW